MINNILGFLKENKHIIALNALLMVFTTILVCIYPLSDIREYYVDRYSSENDYNFLVYGNNAVIQEFSTDCTNIDSFELAISMSETDAYLDGMFTVQLWNAESQVIQEWNMTSNKAYKAEWIQFILDEPFVQGNTYYLFVSAPSLEKENAIVVRGTESLEGVEIDEDINYQSCFYSYYNGYNEGCIYLTLAKHYTNVFGVIAIILSFIALNYYWISKDKRIEQYCFGLIVLLGLIMLAIMADGSGCDEKYHYETSYRLSSVILGADDINTISAENTFIYDEHYNGNNSFVQELTNKHDSQLDEMNSSHNRLELPIYHLFPAMGMALARVLGISGAWLYLVARFSNLLAYAALCRIALEIMPIKKELMLICAINPMAIHQASQLSYDATIIALSFIYVAIIVKAIVKKDIIKWQDIGILLGLLILFSNIKLVYYAHLLLLLSIPWIKYGSKIKKLLSVVGSMGIVFAINRLIVIIAASSKLELGVSANRPEPSYTAEAIAHAMCYSLNIAINKPIEYLEIMGRTISSKAWTLVMEANGSLLAGWTVDVAGYLIVIYIVAVLIVAFNNSQNAVRLDSVSRRWIGITALVEILLITSAGFLMTQVGLTVLDGLQGRYYIPCIILVLLALNTDKIKNNISIPKAMVAVFFVYVGIVFEVMRQIYYW